MGAIQGLLNLTSTLAANGGNADELANEWQETIFVRNSRGYNVGTSLFGLMSRLSIEPADNIEYNWFERDPIRKTLYSGATAAGTVGATTISLGGGSNAFTALDQAHKWLIPGTLIMNDVTREHMLVTTAPTTASTVTVVRNVAFTTGGGVLTQTFLGTVTATDTFTIVTLGKAEGADAVSGVYEAPETRTNYIQTFNSSVEVTNAFKGSVLRSDIDGPLNDRRIQALEKIGRDIEFALLLGVKRRSTTLYGTGVGYQYYTGGIWQALQEAGLGGAYTTGGTNMLNGLLGTGIAVTTFNNFLSAVLPFGSETKIAFCGPSAFAAFSNFANSATNGYRIMQNETVFGMSISEVQTPFGSLGLTQHPLLREAVGCTNMMFIVDLAMLTQKTFEKLFLEPNIQAFGNDSYKEQYRAKLGLKLKFPQAFGIAYDFTKLVA